MTFFVTYSILDNRSVCWPGYFLSRGDHQGGAMWDSLLPGDTVRVWIVDVDGQRLFIEAATHWDAGDRVQQEIQEIVDSIRFE